MYSLDYLQAEKVALWDGYYMMRSSRFTHGGDFMNHAKMYRIQKYLLQRIAQCELEMTHIQYEHFTGSKFDGKFCSNCKIELPEFDNLFEFPEIPPARVKSVFEKDVIEYGDIFGDIE